MNPYLVVLRSALPYILAAAAGFVPAWWLQGLRIDSLKSEHASYVAAQEKAVTDAKQAAQKAKDQADHDYQVSQAELAKEVERGEVFRRCVAAGKCGAVVRMQSCSSQAGTVPPARITDEASPNSVPAQPGRAEGKSEAPAVVNECAETTLTLNRLQALIEGQPGY